MTTFETVQYYEGSSYLQLVELQYQVIRNFTRLASLRLRELLETKHLYQRISIDPKDIISGSRSRALYEEAFDTWCGTELPHKRLLLAREEQFSEKPYFPLPTLVLQNVKLSCKKCESRQAFVPAWYMDFAAEARKSSESPLGIKFSYPSSLPWGFQLLLLIYQCQSCQGVPEALLVRRTGWDLELHGRSLMEQIEVPKYIPKTEYNLFRDSLIAFNSGKVLAALFYLRSFIEQFARRVTKTTGKVTGDKIMDAYNETIPLKHRDSMPSLREWYDTLSGPIHEAKDDVQVFESAREKIEKHFEIRKVFDIPESTPGEHTDKTTVPTSPRRMGA